MILEAATDSASWWSTIVGSGLLTAIGGLIWRLVVQRGKGITRESAAGALRSAIDSFARDMVAEGKPSTAKNLTRRVDAKLTEKGAKVKAHNDTAVRGLGTIATIAAALKKIAT